MKITVIYSFRKIAHLICALFCLSVLAAPVTAQQSTGVRNSGNFQAELVLGVNFSQLDGDRLSGFNKLGLRPGLKIGYPISHAQSVSLGIYYDQRGSSTGIINTSFKQFIALDYFSLPISINFHSWWFEPLERHKIRIIGSLIPARLINTRSSHSEFDNATDQFKKWDLAVSFGIAYAIGPRGALHLHLQRSLLKVYKIPGSDLSGLQSYLVNIGYSYWMNEG